MNGWFPMWRKITTSAVFKDAELLRLWVYLLAEANWSEGQLLNGQTLQPGQLVLSMETLGTMFGCHKTTIMRRLDKLSTLGMIDRKSQRNTQRHGTVVTICNYTRYAISTEGDATLDATTTQRRRNDDATTTQLEGKGNKERRVKQEQEPNGSCLPPAEGESAESRSQYGFPIRGGKTWYLTARKLDEYRDTYSDLDLDQQFRKARQWLRDHPTKRKTAKGMPRFLTGWMNTALDSCGGSVKSNGKRGPSTSRDRLDGWEDFRSKTLHGSKGTDEYKSLMELTDDEWKLRYKGRITDE